MVDPGEKPRRPGGPLFWDVKSKTLLNVLHFLQTTTLKTAKAGTSLSSWSGSAIASLEFPRVSDRKILLNVLIYLNCGMYMNLQVTSSLMA